MTAVTLLRPGSTALADADRDLVAMVAAGDPDKRIATRLGRSRTAVTTRIRQLMTETGTQTRAHLVAVALDIPSNPAPWTDTPEQIAQRRADMLADLDEWEAAQGIGYHPARRPSAAGRAA